MVRSAPRPTTAHSIRVSNHGGSTALDRKGEGACPQCVQSRAKDEDEGLICA
jgi:hypothetical protein